LYIKLKKQSGVVVGQGERTLQAMDRLHKLELIYFPEKSKDKEANAQRISFIAGLDTFRNISQPDPNGRFVNLDILESNVKGMSTLINTLLPSKGKKAEMVWKKGQEANERKGQELIEGATENERKFITAFRTSLTNLSKLIDRAKELNGEILKIIQENPVRVEVEEIGPGIHQEEE